MGHKKITGQWADGPFKLVETPRHAKRISGKQASGAVNLATDMSLAHNMLIRALNCIYLQSPFIPTKLIPDFTTFMQAWIVSLENHHLGEETRHFPWLEEMIGVPGKMQVNVDQHHEFEPGVKAFTKYVAGLKSGSEQYDGQKVRELIDGFGPILLKHLEDEIGTLVELEQFDKVDWKGFNARIIKDETANADVEFQIPLSVTNLDTTFEAPSHDGLWPPWPFIAGWLFRFWYIPKQKRVWRFSCCDGAGNPKELEFLGPVDVGGK